MKLNPGNIMRYSIIIPLLFLLLFPVSAWGSLGISPARIENYHLLPGSEFEKTLIVSREAVSDTAQVLFEINGEDISSWTTLKTQNSNLVFTPNQKTIELPFRITIPKNTPYGSYQGSITIKILETKNKQASGTTQLIGIQIPIKMTIAEDIHTKLTLKNVTVSKAWAPQKFIGITESGKIILSANINNEGNQLDTPTKAILRIHDHTNNQILHTAESKNFNKIKPFQEGSIDISFTSLMRPGVYTAYVTLLSEHVPISTKPHKLELYIEEAKKYTVKEHAITILSEYQSILVPLLLALSAGAVSLFSLFAFKRKRNDDPFISCAIDRPSK